MKDKIILMYHSIGRPANGEAGAELYCVSANNFRGQMEYASLSAKVNSQWPIANSQNRKNHRPSAIDYRPIIITFDDGDITNYQYAYPTLKDFGLRAGFFILVSKAGTQGYMSWAQIKELKDEGMLIGSHGLTHRILTELSDGDLDYELKESKRILEENLSAPVDYLSIPRGFYNKKVIEKAKELGYKAVFTSTSKDSDGFKLGRIPVKGSWDLAYFKKILDNGLSLKDKAGELLKTSSKKILGPKRYDRIRTAVLKK